MESNENLMQYFTPWSEEYWFRTFFRTAIGEDMIADAGWVISGAKVGDKEYFVISSDNHGQLVVPQINCQDWS